MGQSSCLWPRRSWGGAPSVGLRKPFPSLPSPSEWISDYADSLQDPEALRVDVDTFMEAYDKKIAEVGLP